MSSGFPSFAAFGGVKGFGEPRTVVEYQEQPLSNLNQGFARLVDTFIYNYPQLVRQGPFARVTGTAQDVTVAIIGGGFAGATAAYELHQAGIKPENIKIYEARRENTTGNPVRIGGRAYSHKFQDGEQSYVCEMGPMRVPANAKLFWHYLSKIVTANPKQEVFPNPGVVATQLIFRGLKYKWVGNDVPQPEQEDPQNVDWEKLSTDINLFINSLSYDDQTWGLLTLGEISNLLQKDEDLTEDEQEKIKAYWKHFLLKYNDVPFIKALEDYFGDRWGENEYSMFSTLGLGTGGFGPLFPVCFLEIIRILLWDYGDEYIPHKTDNEIMPMAEIVKELIETSIGSSNVIRQAVDYIGMADDKVRVYSINNENKIDENDYDYVIVATTLRSMQIRMNLDAKYPPRSKYLGTTAVFCDDYKIRESLRIPHIMNSSKLFGLVKPKPWKNLYTTDDWPKVGDQPVKCILTDTLARQMYFLDPYPNNDDAGSNVLISYNWGDDSVKIMAIRNYEPWQVIGEEKNSDVVLKNAYKFGLEGSDDGESPIAKALELITGEDKLASIVWQEESMIFGAFKLDYPNQYYATSQLVYQYQQAEKRVYLAGNNCSLLGGWIEGAMQSGVNASAAILKHMKSQYCQEVQNFRMDALFEANPFQEVLDELEQSSPCFKGEL